jgi:hypothetical protein
MSDRAHQADAEAGPGEPHRTVADVSSVGPGSSRVPPPPAEVFWLLHGVGCVAGGLLVWSLLEQVKYRLGLSWLTEHEAWQWWSGLAVLAVAFAVVGLLARRSAALLWPAAVALGVGAVLVCVPDPVFRVLAVGALLSIYVAAQTRRRPGVTAEVRAGQLLSMLGRLALAGAGFALSQVARTSEGPATGLTDVTIGVEVLAAFAVLHLAAGRWSRRGRRWIARACCAVGAMLLATVLVNDAWRAAVGEALDTVSAEFELATGLTAWVGAAFLLATWGWILLACRGQEPDHTAETTAGATGFGPRARRALASCGVAAAIAAAVTAGVGVLVAPRFLGPVAARINTGIAAYAVAFHPDGNILAVAGAGRDGAAVELWEVPARRRIATLTAAADSDGLFRSVAFSRDGSLLAAGGYNSLSLWKVTTQNRIDLPTGDVRGTWRIAFSGDSRTLAVGESHCDTVGSDPCRTVSTVSLWDVSRRQKTAQLPMDDSEVTNLQFSPTSPMLVTEHLLGASRSTRVKLWDIPTLRPIGTPRENTNLGGFTPDGRLLALGGERVRLYDAATHQPAGEPFGNTDTLHMAFRPDGRLVAATHHPDPWSRGSYVQLWDITTRRPVGDRLPPSATYPLKSLAFAPNGHTLAVADGYDVVRLWEIGRYRTV